MKWAGLKAGLGEDVWLDVIGGKAKGKENTKENKA
jgi:hypothetical protein